MGIRKIASKISGMSPRIEPTGVPKKPQMPKIPAWQRALGRALEKLPLDRLDSGMREARKSLERDGYRPRSAAGAKPPAKPFLAAPKKLGNKPFLTTEHLQKAGLLDGKGKLVENLTITCLKDRWLLTEHPPAEGYASVAQFKNAGLLTPKGELARGLTLKKLQDAGIVKKAK
ncbi:MAG: hypothetical protein WC792_00535 [Candidatus Micrarchaeia archaeon]|jgi:hypothetical protein